MLYVLLFTFGLIIGSFLNVVAFRYSEGREFLSAEHIGGRSQCRHCHQQLAWYELIPVASFLMQGGRCWLCRKRLSWQYPLVELASGFVFLLPFYFLNNFQPDSYAIGAGIVWMAAFLIFLLIWAIDFRLYLIPDELNVMLVLLGLILTDWRNLYGQFGETSGSFIGSYAALFGLRGSGIWANHWWAAILGALMVGLIILVSRGQGMGMGDLKFLGALGLLYGWPDVLMIFIFAVMIGATVSLVLMAFRRKKMQSLIPFGPFLVLGALSVFFFGEQILRSYFNFFGF